MKKTQRAFTLVELLVVMAIIVDEGDKAAILATAGADLRFLFDRKGVDEDFAVKLYSIGITTVELFAVFAKDQADLEATLAHDGARLEYP